MSEDFSDIMGAPDGKAKVYGLVLMAPATSSFHWEMIARSMEAQTSARIELGRDFEVEFIEADEPDMPKFFTNSGVSEPMDEAAGELAENADAILTALASLWVLRCAIAKATGDLLKYRAACAAENITPGI